MVLRDKKAAALSTRDRRPPAHSPGTDLLAYPSPLKKRRRWERQARRGACARVRNAGNDRERRVGDGLVCVRRTQRRRAGPPRKMIIG